MNVIYAKTVSGVTITHCRPDQDYTGIVILEEALTAAAVESGSTVAAYAVAGHEAVAALCITPEDYNTRLQVCHKEDVPEGATIVLPDGVILGDVPAEAFVVYITA